jgi:hypothetical protein
MDISDLLAGREHASVYRSCRAQDLLRKAALPDDVEREIWAYVDDAPGLPRLTAPALSKYLVSNGIPVSVDAIRRHRRRECACPDRKDTDE